MRGTSTFAVTGLLVILSVNHLYASKLSAHLKTVHEELKDKGKDVQKSVESSIMPLAKHPENFENYIRVGAAVASMMAPQPLGLVIGLTSSVFFAFYDAHQLKKEEELKKLEESKRFQEEESFKKTLITDIHEIGQTISSESQRIIDTVTKAIDNLADHVSSVAETVVETLTNVFYEHALLYDLRVALNYFTTYYTENVNCLLKSECTPEERDDILDKLVLRSSEFRSRLSTFVTQFIHTTETLPTSGNQERGFFYYLRHEFQQRLQKGRACNVETEQAEVYRLYLSIMLTLEKSYSMVVAAHMIRYRQNPSNRTLSSSQFASAMRVLKKANTDAVIVGRVARDTISQLSTEIRRCDPAIHKRGVTYDRFVQLYGTYMGFTWTGFRRPNQTYEYIDTKVHPVKRLDMLPGIPDGLYGSTLNGMIRLGNRCVTDHSTAEIAHYYLENDTERLYHHIKVFYKNGSTEIFGRSSFNEGETWIARNFSSPFKISGQYFKQFVPTLVEKCPVQMAFTNNSVRHVSLVSVSASPQHVVTGIRWRIKDKVLYLEIQEGKAVDNGASVNASSVHWKNTPTRPIEGRTVPIGDDGIKGFIMDDMRLGPGYVITGVRFVWDDSLQQGNELIRLQVEGSRWDQKIHKDRSSLALPKNILRLPIDQPDAPEYAPYNALLSKPGQHFVHFQMTDMKKDASQTSVPYLDIQEVVTKPPRALNGVGLYYKGKTGFGGFIGLRAFAADISSEIDPDLLALYGKTIDVMMDELNDLTSQKN